MLAFQLNLDQTELFFRICQELHAETEEQRVQILSLMAQRGQVVSIVDTKMDKDQYIKHLASKFGSVMNITNKKDIKNA